MDDALAHWLALREPADFAARSEALTHAIAETIDVERPVRLLDLATGTGSNIRYLAARLPANQRWLAVDRSAGLLAELPRRMSPWCLARGCHIDTEGRRTVVRGAGFACDIETRQADLSTLDDTIFAGRHIVTASALLDLVSEPWLMAVAARCLAERASALFTITYNGRFTCRPAEAEDEMVRDLMNRHQKTDKGLGGRAAGPDAAACAERCFREAGYRVRREPSDWRLGPGDGELQRLLIDGWAEAATEVEPGSAATISHWRARRLAHVAAGQSHVVVGHDDLAAWPPDIRRSL